MSLREIFPKPQLPRTHYFLTLSRGEVIRTFAVPASALHALLAMLPMVLIWLAASTLYVAFHDDLLAGMMSKQFNVQYAYEDRLGTLRAELERVSSHQLLERDSLESRIADMAARQTLLEGRASMIASLAEIVVSSSHEGANAKSVLPPRLPPAAAKQPQREIVPEALSFAPVSGRKEFPALTSQKPRPETQEPQQRNEVAPIQRGQKNSEADVSPGRMVDKLAMSLDAVEFNQVKSLANLYAPVQAKVTKLRSAISDVGLSPDTLNVPTNAIAVGGPFIPLKVDAARSPFEREFAGLQNAVAGLERLQRLMPYLPLRAPLPGDPDITSTFGMRVDPFLGRAAMHSGIDFREEYGSAVRSTAAGKIINAGPSGGYGIMVEIDHGNGLSTRYGHLSAISVNEGDWVKSGATIGRLGSTGRSTGPHLHYETRMDDEAIDPARFLRSGRNLLGNK